MDNLFKNRFENFESEPPKQMLEQVLGQIESMESTSLGRSPIHKAWIYGVPAIVLVALVSSVLIFNSSDDNQDVSKVLEAPAPVIIKSENNPNQIVENKTKKENNKLIISTSNTNKNSQKTNEEIITQPQKPCNSIKPEPGKVNTLNGNDNGNVKIIADRYSCSGSAKLKVQGYNGDGEWSSSIPVQFSNLQSTQCQVYTNYVGGVLFTYTNANCSDTFTVFFNKPSDRLSYEIRPASCGDQNAELIFNFPKDRTIQSICKYQLNNNRVTQLSAEVHYIELSDQYNCVYKYDIKVPEVKLKTQISYDALDYIVDYPIYFKSDLDIEGAEYVWDFGDGETGYDSKASHKYEKPGTYEVKLEVIKGDCSETASIKKLEIKDRPLAIPNIFTPNNDGENDEFFISVPEQTQSFEAIIVTKTGQLVYKWNDPKGSWDGRWHSGQEAESGSYYYVVRGKDINGKSFEYKSFLELVR